MSLLGQRAQRAAVLVRSVLGLVRSVLGLDRLESLAPAMQMDLNQVLCMLQYQLIHHKAHKSYNNLMWWLDSSMIEGFSCSRTHCIHQWFHCRRIKDKIRQSNLLLHLWSHWQSYFHCHSILKVEHMFDWFQHKRTHHQWDLARVCRKEQVVHPDSIVGLQLRQLSLERWEQRIALNKRLNKSYSDLKFWLL